MSKCRINLVNNYLEFLGCLKLKYQQLKYLDPLEKTLIPAGLFIPYAAS